MNGPKVSFQTKEVITMEKFRTLTLSAISMGVISIILLIPRVFLSPQRSLPWISKISYRLVTTTIVALQIITPIILLNTYATTTPPTTNSNKNVAGAYFLKLCLELLQIIAGKTSFELSIQCYHNSGITSAKLSSTGCMYVYSYSNTLYFNIKEIW